MDVGVFFTGAGKHEGGHLAFVVEAAGALSVSIEGDVRERDDFVRHDCPYFIGLNREIYYIRIFI